MERDTLYASLGTAVAALLAAIAARAARALRSRGVPPPPRAATHPPALDWRALFEASPAAVLVLAPSPAFEIVAVSTAYCVATMQSREQLVGRALFDVFPDRPDDPAADGEAHLRASLGRVLAHRRADTMPEQRYPIQDPSGRWEERWWLPVNVPVLGAGREVLWILHHVEDVTEGRAGGASAGKPPVGGG